METLEYYTVKACLESLHREASRRLNIQKLYKQRQPAPPASPTAQASTQIETGSVSEAGPLMTIHIV